MVSPEARESDTRTRSRSRSPIRDEPRQKKQKTGGFKWKEKRPVADIEAGKAGAEDKGLKRGYRDRSPRRDSYRERNKERDRSPRREERKPRGSNTDSYRPSGDDDLRKHDDPLDRVTSSAREPTSSKRASTEKPAEKDKPKKAPKPAAPTEPMIIVNINDRLGTKAAIPCLASDSIKAFKAIVAANIGRQPHEIMLKRQGERPFKDQLTLEDYGVSSGVQLDLEIDTGD